MRVVVIGGGAAGYFAAIECARKSPEANVRILEAGFQTLAKVKVSGGGRCNVTHNCFEASELIQYYPRGGKALRGAFSRFQPLQTVEWFAKEGVKLKTEEDGRMFPTTDRSQTIIDCLSEAAQRAGVLVKTEVMVTAVVKTEQGFELQLKSGEIIEADRILLATGSNGVGHRIARSLGHTIITPVPSLFTLTIKDKRLQGLAGVSVDRVRVSLVEGQKTVSSQLGPLLVTHWGISGPVVLKLSAWGARVLAEHRYRMPLLINWLPDLKGDELRSHLKQFKAELAKKQIESFCPFSLPKRLWERLVQQAGITCQTTWSQLSKTNLEQLATELSQGNFLIEGKGVFKDEFVTAGGVDLKEVNFKTMESKLCPGLYFAGEVLNIDGVTGGFNFQSAWTTGWIAGQGMAS